MSRQSKIPVAILGATGAVGQRFAQLLTDHPWFEITALAASERSAGKRYAEACNWVIPGDPAPALRDMTVHDLTPDLPARLVFSALPADVAREVEPQFAAAGYIVCSNASAFRYEPDVPLLIPELNAEHTALIARQRAERGWPGCIVASPNCTTTGIAMALKPLDLAFGVQKLSVVTLQAISGAGYPGVPSLDILGNVIPNISGEEAKIEKETRQLLGRLEAGQRVDADIAISAQVTRVPVLDGHTVCLSVGFARKPEVEEAIAALEAYCGPELARGLPSAPARPVLVRREWDRPQPRRDRDAEGGMATTVGRIRPCALLDLRLVAVVHNTLRGAASGAILNAELLVAQDYVS